MLVGTVVFVGAVAGLAYREFSRTGTNRADRALLVAVAYVQGDDGIYAHVLPYRDTRHLGGAKALSVEIDGLLADQRAGRGPAWDDRREEIDRWMPKLDQQLRARRRATDRRGMFLGAGAAVAFVAYLVLAGLLSGRPPGGRRTARRRGGHRAAAGLTSHPWTGEPSARSGRHSCVTIIDMPRISRVLLVGAVWVLATLFGLGVAATTTIGPTVLTLSYNHGMHLGDLLAFAGAYAVAAVITTLLLGGRRRT